MRSLTMNLYKEKFKCDNPNLQILKELMDAGVEFYVCGQTMQKRNIDTKKLVAGTKVASSGLYSHHYLPA